MWSSFFDDILNTASVDYSSKEIEDIQTAVLELERELLLR